MTPQPDQTSASPLSAAQADWVLGQLGESAELRRMTPEQLADAALKASENVPMGSRLYNVISEMMNRIDPAWTTRHVAPEDM